jgi:hypothetical protein
MTQLLLGLDAPIPARAAGPNAAVLGYRPAAPGLVERLRRLGVPAAVPVHLHRNRQVMVSRSGAGLRVHAGYESAPDPVVAAIAAWAKPGSRPADRRAAARVFLGFSVHQGSPPARRRRPEPPAPGDALRLAKLEGLHRVLNQRWFAGSLSEVPIELSGRMRRKLGHYEPRANGRAVIVLSRRHLRRDGWSRAADTLLHEMVHQWQDESGLPVDHGPGFRRKAVAVGIEPRAIAIDR